MKQIKGCSNCIRGMHNNINTDILCMFKGVVSHDFVCAKYKTVHVIKSAIEQRYKCMDCEFFITDTLNTDNLSRIGFCQLFTVRQFDGKQKNACSKFCSKSELIVL